MKPIRQEQSLKNPLVLTAVIAAILASYLLAAHFFQIWPFNASASDDAKSSTDNSSATTDSDASNTSENTDALNKKEFVEKAQNPESTPEPRPAPTEPNTISIKPTQQGDTITISTELQGYAAGTCELNITNGTATYRDSADIIYQPQFSTCAGFTAPRSNLGAGTWNISLRAIPDGSAAVTNSTTLEVK